MATAQRESHRLVLFSLLLLLLVMIALVGLFGYGLFYPPSQTFASLSENEQGQAKIKAITALSKPVARRDVLLHWASLAVTSANNYSASNYRENLQQVIKDFFTTEGGEAYMAELENSGTIERVVKDRLIISAVVIGPPVILKQGILAYGVFLQKYTWKIQMPILVTYQTTSTTIEKKKFIVTLLVVEMPTWLSKNGIGIQQYLVSKA